VRRWQAAWRGPGEAPRPSAPRGRSDDEREGALVEGVEEGHLPRLPSRSASSSTRTRRTRRRGNPRRGRSARRIGSSRTLAAVGLPGAGLAPQVEDALRQARDGGANGRQRLGVPAGNDILRGRRGRRATVSRRKLPHRDSLGLRRGGEFRRPAWPGRAPRQGRGARLEIAAIFYHAGIPRPERFTVWQTSNRHRKGSPWPSHPHPDPLRTLRWRPRHRAGRAAAHRHARGEARPRRPHQGAPEGLDAGVRRTLTTSTRTCRTSPRKPGAPCRTRSRWRASGTSTPAGRSSSRRSLHGETAKT